MDHERRVEELGRFADLDWTVTQGTTDEGDTVAFRQKGVNVRITFQPSGSVHERRGDAESTYSSYYGLLASPHFADLRQLARMQLALLQRATEVPSFDIPMTGDLHALTPPAPGKTLLDQLDDWTVNPGQNADVHAIVLDGPAGIGKTHLIMALVRRRASAFGPAARPLVLHVQSRGRQLTTLPDLLAGTLQSMRLGLTYEQIPVLARHGLIQIAIDGFDELADPNGYETAWRSLRDLLADIRGRGVVLLAGRDTFIDADSVRRALPILSANAVASIHLRPPTPQEATAWLDRGGLDKDKIAALESAGLLDEGGYALRPFFLRKIRSLADSNAGMSLLTSFPLGTLVKSMVRREVPLAKALRLEIDDEKLEQLLFQLFQEIAREMADSESDSIDGSSLQLITEIVFGPHLDQDALRALRNRVKSIALLDSDVLPDRRRFVHSEVQGYFTARAYVQLLAGQQIEISRSMRRSILGAELLEIFHDVTQAEPKAEVESMRRNAVQILRSRRYDDRSPGNIAALILASLDSTHSANHPILIDDLALDECLVRGSTGPATIRRTTISKLDARAADASNLSFEDSQVMSLVADSATRLSLSFPAPTMLTIDENGRQRSMYAPEEIKAWLDRKGVRENLTLRGPMAGSASQKLLDRVCRTIVRQSWIRDIDDDRAGRLLRDPSWPRLRASLLKYGLLEERTDVPAGGQRSTFLRVRRARDLLDADFQDATIADLYKDLMD